MPDDQQRIETDPDVMMGKAVVRGTRVTVETILERLAAGEEMDDVLEAFPHLEREDIQAALQYAADVLSADDVSSVPRQGAR